MKRKFIKLDRLKKLNKNDLSDLLKKAKQSSKDATEWGKERIEANKENLEVAKKTVLSTCNGAKDFSIGLAGGFISNETIQSLQNDVENQGGNYRELKSSKKKRYSKRDSFILGGEIFYLNSWITLLTCSLL